MDEPCSALDPIATAKIEELIDELQERLYASSSSPIPCSRRRACSDCTAFFYLGELIEVGATEEDFHQPAEKTDRRLHHRPLRLNAAGGV